MEIPKHSSNNNSSREFKNCVLTCLNKLFDRDTHSAAATELESIAKSLPQDSISSFLSSISATNAPVRKQCVRLISILSEARDDKTMLYRRICPSSSPPSSVAATSILISAWHCAASAIDGASDSEPVYLRRRIEKLLKCDNFKAKAALLTIVGSVMVVEANFPFNLSQKKV